MKCPSCGRVLAAGDRQCAACGTPRPAVAAPFAQAEQAYVRLRQEYDSGALAPDQFKAAVESQIVDYGGRYWMLGVNSGRWYAHDGGAWHEADPPEAATPGTRDAATEAGGPEPLSSAPATQAGAPLPQRAEFCTSCGTPHAAGDTFCSNCGAQLG